MEIFINDEAIECPENSTISQILSQEGIVTLNIAIALDNVVVPKAQWESTVLKPNCRLIIIKAMQGG